MWSHCLILHRGGGGGDRALRVVWGGGGGGGGGLACRVWCMSFSCRYSILLGAVCPRFRWPLFSDTTGSHPALHPSRLTLHTPSLAVNSLKPPFSPAPSNFSPPPSLLTLQTPMSCTHGAGMGWVSWDWGMWWTVCVLLGCPLWGLALVSRLHTCPVAVDTPPLCLVRCLVG